MAKSSGGSPFGAIVLGMLILGTIPGYLWVRQLTAERNPEYARLQENAADIQIKTWQLELADKIEASARHNQFWNAMQWPLIVASIIALVILLFLLIQLVLGVKTRNERMALAPADNGILPIKVYRQPFLLRMVAALYGQQLADQIVNHNIAPAMITLSPQGLTPIADPAGQAATYALRARFMGVQEQAARQALGRKPTAAEVKASVGAKGYTPWADQKMLTQMDAPEQDDEGNMIVDAPSWSVAAEQMGSHEVALGWSSENAEIARWNIRTDPHFAIYGKTRTGKSLFVGLPVSVGWLKHGWPLLVLDPENGKDFSALSPWAKVIQLDSNDLSLNRSIWGSLQEEFGRRTAYMQRTGAQTYLQTDLPPLGIFFEEFQHYWGRAQVDGKIATEMRDVLAAIAQRGAKLGMHLLLWAQQPQDIPREVDFNLLSLTLRQSSKAAQVMQDWDAKNLKPGEFIYEGEVYNAWRLIKFNDEPGGKQFGPLRVDDDFGQVLARLPQNKEYHFGNSPFSDFVDANPTIPLPPPINRPATLRPLSTFSAPAAVETRQPAPAQPAKPVHDEEFGPWTALVLEWLRQHPDRLSTGPQRGDISEIARLIADQTGEDYLNKKSTALNHLNAAIAWNKNAIWD